MGAEVATTKANPVAKSTAKLPSSELETHQSGPLTGLAAPATTIPTERQDRRSLTPGEVPHLQRTIGNRAVGQLLAAHRGRGPSLIQPKLTVGAANDAYEREADQVAARVINAPSPAMAAPAEPTPMVVNRAMERAAEDEVQTKAFANGKEIHFGAEQYDPGSRAGKELVAHELTHAIQQTGGTPHISRDPSDDAGIQRHFLGALKHLEDEYIQRYSQDSLRVEVKENTNLQRATQESLRGEVNAHDPAKGDIIAYLHTKLTDAKDIAGLVKVVPKPELVTQLAKDLANRAGAAAVSAEHTQAAQRDVDNGGGGFTTLDGLVFCLEGKDTSSALWHELIHVLSGPGGATPLAAFKTNLNEGFTNYFAEEVAASIGGAKFLAYPAATEWVRKFVTKYGRPAAYDIYFKSDVDSLYKLLAETYKTKLEVEKDKPTQSSAIKPTEVKNTQVKGAFVLDKLKTTVQGKLKNAQFLDLAEPELTWLDARCF